MKLVKNALGEPLERSTKIELIKERSLQLSPNCLNLNGFSTRKKQLTNSYLYSFAPTFRSNFTSYAQCQQLADFTCLGADRSLTQVTNPVGNEMPLGTTQQQQQQIKKQMPKPHKISVLNW